MAKQTNDNQELTAEQLLEARVDAMMQVDGKQPVEPSGAPLLPGTKPHHPTKQSIDIKPPAKKPVQPAETVAEVAAEADPPAPIPVADKHDAIVVEPTELDTPDSDAAIDDIVAEEADVVLAAEDAGLLRAQQESEATPKQRHHYKHPIFWFMIFVAVLSVLMIVALTFMPSNTLAP